MWRKDSKGKPEEDTEKAQWYISRYNEIMFDRYGLPFGFDLKDVQEKVDKYK